jgi:hypothetical protein
MRKVPAPPVAARRAPSALVLGGIAGVAAGAIVALVLALRAPAEEAGVEEPEGSAASTALPEPIEAAPTIAPAASAAPKETAAPEGTAAPAATDVAAAPTAASKGAATAGPARAAPRGASPASRTSKPVSTAKRPGGAWEYD